MLDRIIATEEAKFLDKLPVFIEQFNTEDIKFELVRIRSNCTIAEALHLKKSYLNLIDLNLNVSNSKYSFSQEFTLEIPKYSDFGFIIDGNHVTVVSQIKQGDGWYINENGFWLMTSFGRKLEIKIDNDALYFVNDKNKKMAFFDLLSCIYGYDSDYLIKKCKFASQYPLVLNSKTENSKDVIKAEFLSKVIGTVENISNIDIIKKRFLNSIKNNETTVRRYKELVSYKNRIPTNYTILEDKDNYKIIKTDKGSKFISYTLKEEIVEGIPEAEEFLQILEVFCESHYYTNECTNRNDLSNKKIINFDIFENQLSKKLKSIVKALSKNSFNIDTIIKNKIKYFEFDRVQNEELSNCVEIVSKAFKMSLTAKRANNEVLDVKESQYGRICSVESPEGEQIGKIQTIACFTRLNGDVIEAPYYNTKTKLVDFLAPVNEVDKLIGVMDIDDYNKGTAFDMVYARNILKVDNELKTFNVLVPKHKLDYCQYSYFQTISPTLGFIPFFNSNKGKRPIMSCAAVKQATIILRPQINKVGNNVPDFEVGIVRAKDICKENGYPESTKIKIESKNGSEYIFITDKDERFSYVAVKMLPNQKNSIINYKINQELEWFCERDIVMYFEDVVIEGQKYFYSNGRNLCIVFKGHEGFGIEDAVVISADVVNSKIYESIFLFKKDIDLGLGKEVANVTEGNLENGIIKVGSEINENDILIKLKDKIKGTVKEEKAKPGDDGTVIAVNIVGNEIQIIIGRLHNPELGDKYVGRHGNKGVIAKIVPREDMPFLEDGTIPDMILNPLGVPSRDNIGQILEGILGANTTAKYELLSPFNGQERLNEVLAEGNYKQYDLYDGRTGLKFPRKVDKINMHILKLEHLAITKIASIGFTKGNINARFMNPKKGRKAGGGQVASQYELWAFLANDCPKLVRDMYSIYSNDLIAQKDLEKQVEENPYKLLSNSAENRNDILKITLRACGLELSDTGDMRLLTDKDIQNLGTKLEIEDIDFLENKEIFGSMNDAHDATTAYELREKYGYIDVPSMINPLLRTFKVFYSLFPITLYKTKNSYLDRENIKSSFTNENLLRDILMRKNCVILDEDIKVVVGTKTSDIPGAITGVNAVIEMMKFIGPNLNEIIENVKSPELKNDMQKFYSRYSLNDLILTKILVIPLPLRFSIKEENMRSEFDKIYCRIVNFIKNHVNVQQEVFETFDRFTGVLGYKEHSIMDKLGKNDKDSGKKNMISENVLKQRIIMSGRAVIIPDPTLSPYHCGIPFIMARNIYKESIMSVLKSEYRLSREEFEAYFRKDKEYFQSYDSIFKSFEDIDKKVREILDKLASEELFVLIRQPTLQKHSTQAFIPVIYDGLAIKLHPLVCKGYNADFDGDQMEAIRTFLMDTLAEVRANMMIDSQIINPKDRSLNLKLHQDMVLGLYLMTKDEPDNNNIVGTFNNISEAEELFDLGIIRINDTVVVNKKANTVGRILAGVILERVIDQPLTDSKLNDDILVSLLNRENSEIIEILDRLMKMGMKYADLLCGTFTYKDLQKNPKIVDFVKQTEIKYNRYTELFKRGLIGSKGLETCRERLLRKDTKDSKGAETVIMNMVEEDIKLNKSNGLFEIVSSGARGKSSVVKSLMYYNNAVKSLSGLDTDPIFKGTVEGFSPYEFFMQSYDIRSAGVKVYKESSDPGALTKEFVTMMEPLVVTKNVCDRDDFNTFTLLFDITKEDLIKGLLSFIINKNKNVQHDSEDIQDLSTVDFSKINYRNLTTYVDSHKTNTDTLVIDYMNQIFKTFMGYTKVDNKEVTGEELYTILDTGTPITLINNSKDVLIGRVPVDSLEYLDDLGTITERTISSLIKSKTTLVNVYLTVGCTAEGVCARCYGKRYDNNKFPPIGYHVGLLAAESIGEPLTQSTLNSFHGVDSKDSIITIFKTIRDSQFETDNKQDIYDGLNVYLKFRTNNKIKTASRNFELVYKSQTDIIEIIEDPLGKFSPTTLTPLAPVWIENSTREDQSQWIRYKYKKLKALLTSKYNGTNLSGMSKGFIHERLEVAIVKRPANRYSAQMAVALRRDPVSGKAYYSGQDRGVISYNSDKNLKVTELYKMNKPKVKLKESVLEINSFIDKILGMQSSEVAVTSEPVTEIGLNKSNAFGK